MEKAVSDLMSNNSFNETVYYIVAAQIGSEKRAKNTKKNRN